MTAYLADIARWQRDLPLTELVKAGFGAVNIKTSHGLTAGAAIYPGQPDDLARAKEARALKVRLCTFHWLDNSAPGAAQADLAFSRIKAMGGPAGIAHSVDCEDSAQPATWSIWVDYVARMRALLGRPIFAYTGDWWWAARFAGRNGAVHAPHLWAAPNAGYLDAYPGDSSPHWVARYGGWANLAVMQYAVAAPYGSGVTSTVKISKSALREPGVWKACAGVAW